VSQLPYTASRDAGVKVRALDSTEDVVLPAGVHAAFRAFEPLVAHSMRQPLSGSSLRRRGMISEERLS
jgi:hypothetical protein